MTTETEIRESIGRLIAQRYDGEQKLSPQEIQDTLNLLGPWEARDVLNAGSQVIMTDFRVSRLASGMPADSWEEYCLVRGFPALGISGYQVRRLAQKAMRQE